MNEHDEEYLESLGGPSRIDADVLRFGGQQVGGPVPAAEPPIYTTLSFRINHGGKTYDYAAVRAGDGKWYATGDETRQGVDWPTLTRAIRPRLVGPVQVLGPIRNLYL